MSETITEPTEHIDSETDATTGEKMPIAAFVRDFRASLVEAVRLQNPPVYDGVQRRDWNALLDQLTRSPFAAQRDVVHAVCRLLVDAGERAAVINGEMGVGKTMLSIAVAWLMHHLGYPRTLVVCPPHLVYKWRREIKQTVPNARVWILNGPDTLKKLIQLKAMRANPTVPEYFVMGRVRMRMGFNWAPAFIQRRLVDMELGETERLDRAAAPVAACADCFEPIRIPDTDGTDRPLDPAEARARLNVRQMRCAECGGALWSLVRPGLVQKDRREILHQAIVQIPTIGEKTAAKLLDTFGEDMLGGFLEDNVYEVRPEVV